MEQRLRQYFSAKLLMTLGALEVIEEAFRIESDSSDIWNKKMLIGQISKQHNKVERYKFILKFLNKKL